MPTAEFHLVEISSIVVDRDARQRRELRDIEGLADSITRRKGLIHPILIQRDSHALIAGERRLAACTMLGWSHIPAQYEDEVDPGELRLLELEENTKRLDVPWQEQCLAIHEYHRLSVAADATWTQEKTAEALGMDPATASQRLAVATEVLKGNTVITEAPKYSTALGIVKRAEERKADASRAAIAGLMGAPEEPERVPPITIANFLEWAPLYEGPTFNLIHCDFPYGINADERHQGYTQASLGGYADTFQHYIDLLEALINNIDRLASPQAHLMFWFSMEHYRVTLEFLQEIFAVQRFPLVWVKSDNIGMLPDPERGPRRIYETAFLASRGDRKIVRPVSNAISSPTVRSDHMSEKPQAVLEHFMRMLVDASSSVFDPTAGSGSALRAAKALGAERIAGLELNPTFADSANERLGFRQWTTASHTTSGFALDPGDLQE